MPDPVLDPSTRAPSGPLAGFLRASVIVPLASFVAGKLAAAGIPIDATVLTGLLVGLVTAVGKMLRDRGFGWAMF